MPNLQDLTEVAHLWGGDLQLSATGDVARVSDAERSKQRVLRRLLTNPGSYLSHVNYGGGVPASVGAILDIGKTKTLIRGQMLLEASVAQSPPPSVDVFQIADGVQVDISYIALPTRQPATLSFSVAT